MNPFPTRIHIPQRIIPHVAIPVVPLRAQARVHVVVGGEHAAEQRIIHAPVHVDEAKLGQHLVAGVAPVEPVGLRKGIGGVAPVQGITRAAPGVEVLREEDVASVVAEGYRDLSRLLQHTALPLLLHALGLPPLRTALHAKDIHTGGLLPQVELDQRAAEGLPQHAAPAQVIDV